MDGRAVRARQHPAVLPALIALGLMGACAPARPSASVRSTSAARNVAHRRGPACAAAGLPAPHWSDLPAAEIPSGTKVTRVVIRNARPVPPRLVRGVVQMKAGKPLDSRVVAADLQRIWRLEAFSGVRAVVEPDAGGVVLAYVLRERRLVGSIFTDGDHDARLGVHPGDLYDPARLQRRAAAFVSAARDDGHLAARAEVRGRAVDAHTVDLCILAERGPRFVVDRVVFDGNQRVDDATLVGALHTGGGKVNAPGKPYRADLLEQDKVWLSAVYYDRGMLAAQIGEPRVTLHDNHKLTVHLRVDEGPVFQLGQLRFHGRLVASSATYRKLLGMKRGEVFNRSRFLAGLERIRDYHLWRGHASLDVDPDPHLDAKHHTVDLVVKVEKAK